MSKARQEFVAKAFEEYRTVLKRFLYSKLGSMEEAEDLMQETFLRVHQAAGVQRLEHPRAFLFTTANNLVIDRRRRQRLGVFDQYAEVDESRISDFAPSVEENVDSRLRFKRLCDAIVALPPQCRRAFVLRKFYNFSYQEIAAQMGISVKTVEKHLAKGIVACRNHVRRSQSNVIRLQPRGVGTSAKR